MTDAPSRTRPTDRRAPGPGGDLPGTVVVGAGFGGLRLAQRLASAGRPVTLVDRTNHHLFQPLLYQVATAELEPHGVAHPVRAVARRHPELEFRMGEVAAVDLAGRELAFTDDSRLAYDRLVLAPGATTRTLGIEGVREHAFPLKTLADATRLRDHLLVRLERAAARPDEIHDGDLTVVVVGAGPTGVELAGALADLADSIVDRDYPELDPRDLRIVLAEALPEVLPAFGDGSRRWAHRRLERRGVEVLVDHPLAGVAADRVTLEGGRTLAARTTVWAAGVRAQPFLSELGVETAGGGRVVVGDDLTVPDHPEVWVIGDACGGLDEQGDPYPQLAPVAIQQADYVAERLLGRGDGHRFRYRPQGIMATVGARGGVAEFPSGLRLHGPLAWVAWLSAHLLFLVGFRNRAGVVLDWAYNGVSRRRAAGSIVSGDQPPRRTPGDDLDRDRDG